MASFVDASTLIVFFACILSVIYCVIVKTFVRIPFTQLKLEVYYWIPPIVAVLLLLVIGALDFQTIHRGIAGDEHIQPYAILILFMSLAYVCISVDLTGMFAFIALYIAKKAKAGAKTLYFYFFWLSSFLTLFTSNDIVILTLTPIIYYLTEMTKLSILPFAIMEFFASNIWSAGIFVGNPTNIIVAEAYKITFFGYTYWMLLPTVVCGFSCLIFLSVFFRNDIYGQFAQPPVNEYLIFKDKAGGIFGIACLGLCLGFLIVSPIFNFSLWKICLSFAIVLFCRNFYKFVICKNIGFLSDNKEKLIDYLHEHDEENIVILQSVNKKQRKSNLSRQNEVQDFLFFHSKENKLQQFIENYMQMEVTIWTAFYNCPWAIVPFVLSMFTIVQAMMATGWVDYFATFYYNIIDGASSSNLIMNLVSCQVIGWSSILAANFLNNQPMTILFTRILLSDNFKLQKPQKMGAMFSLILGSNFGACFTIIGALAGIMWINILRSKNVQISYLKFAKLGICIMSLGVFTSFIVLALEITVLHV